MIRWVQIKAAQGELATVPGEYTALGWETWHGFRSHQDVLAIGPEVQQPKYPWPGVYEVKIKGDPAWRVGELEESGEWVVLGFTGGPEVKQVGGFLTLSSEA